MTMLRVPDLPIDSLQRAAAEAEEGPTLLIGGPGTGKSHTIIARVAMLLKGGASAHTITCLTFSGRGADELRRQMETIPLTAGHAASIFIGTIHNYASFYIRRVGHTVLGISPHFTIWDRNQAEEVIAEMLDLQAGRDGTVPMAEISKILDWYDRNQKRGTDEAIPPNDASWLRIIEQYNEEKRKNNTLAIEEIIPLAIRAMETDQETRTTWSATRTRHLLVDEFQDITPRQYHLLNLMTGPTRSILVAADPNQSINRWRGADPTLLEQFQLDQGSRLNTRMLRINHRGTEVLSGLAATLTKSNDMEGLNYDYQSAVRPDGEIPTLNRYETTPQEMDRHILNWAETLMHQGTSWEDMAVIYRTHRTINRMMSQFSGHQIPYTILGNTPTDRNSNAEAITAMLALVLNPSDVKAFTTAAGGSRNTKPRQLNREITKMIHKDAMRGRTDMVRAAADYIHKLDPGAPSIRGLQYVTSAWHELNQMLDTPGVDLYDICRRANTLLLESQRASHGGSIQEPQTFRLMSLSQTTPRMGQENMREFTARFLELMASALEPDHQSAENGDPFAHNQGVTFATIHQAKGMQWKMVWVVDAHDSVMPLGRRDESERDIGEEERVFYVAATRATNQLHFCYSASDDHGRELEPSRFFRVIEEDLEERTITRADTPVKPVAVWRNPNEPDLDMEPEDDREPEPEPDFEPAMDE